MRLITDALVILLGYLLGSLPFAFLLTKLSTGKDIRYEGDGNVGTRNALRVAGPLPGLFTAVLDVSKGAAAYWVGRKWGSSEMVLYLTGFALMVGHGFPVWLGWRGGKGLACASGFLFQMWPYAVLAGLAVLLIARTLMRNFDLAFAAAAAAFFSLTFVEGNDLTRAIFVVLFLGMAGAKKLLDLPHERAVRAKAGQAHREVYEPETQHQHTQ